MSEVLQSNGSTNGHQRGVRTATPTLPPVIDQMFPNSVLPPAPATGVGTPPTNLIETWDAYAVQLALPGVDPTTLQIAMVARRLTVTGAYRPPANETGSYLWQAIPSGECSALVELPVEVDPDKARARYDGGILTVELPKVAYLKPTSIQLDPLC